MTIGTTTAATESLNTFITGADTLNNRSIDIPSGAILKRILFQAWATDATPVAGRHECLMYHLPAATTLATPIASWVNATHPLPEEAIQIRQLALGKLNTKYVITGAAFPLKHVCAWRGNKLMQSGDDVVVSLLDTNATNWDATCDYSWIA